MRYFTISELASSQTATLRGIRNIPDSTVQRNLQSLTESILDPLREAWGSGIRVNSGYRSPALNKAVGGSSTSAHCYGYAADLYPSNGKIGEFKEFVMKWLKTNDVKFDQYINEYSGNSQWVHIALKNSKGQQRGQFLVYKGGKYSKIC